MFFLISLEELYRKPEKNEISSHSGEFNGIKSQINKLNVGIINEFLCFLRKNQDIVNSIQFKIIEKKLNKEVLNYWKEINIIATGSYKKDNFLSKIATIRSNVSFHYDESLSQLKEGFIEKFFNIHKDASNKNAFFSLGSEMSNTRFYYCDGALEQYLKKNLIVDDKNFFKECSDLVDKINHTIFNLMSEYLKRKKIQK